jgi:RIO-like serine/threonine protein kinase
MSLQSTSLDLALYARPDLIVLKIICSTANNDESVPVNVFNITDREGIEREEAKQMLKSLQNEKLVKIVNTDMDWLVTITRQAIDATKFMITAF